MARRIIEGIEIETSSGNVFADLGLADADGFEDDAQESGSFEQGEDAGDVGVKPLVDFFDEVERDAGAGGDFHV